MKVGKHITIDIELIKRLQGEDNASELINSLLISHYQIKADVDMTKEERIASLRKELKIAKAKEAYEKVKEEALNGKSK